MFSLYKKRCLKKSKKTKYQDINVLKWHSTVEYQLFQGCDYFDLGIAEKMLDQYLVKFKLANRDIRIFRKIMNLL